MMLRIRKLVWRIRRPKNLAQVAERLWRCGLDVDQAWRVVNATSRGMETRDPVAVWNEVKRRGWTRVSPDPHIPSGGP